MVPLTSLTRANYYDEEEEEEAEEDVPKKVEILDDIISPPHRNGWREF